MCQTDKGDETNNNITICITHGQVKLLEAYFGKILKTATPPLAL